MGEEDSCRQTWSEKDNSRSTFDHDNIVWREEHPHVSSYFFHFFSFRLFLSVLYILAKKCRIVKTKYCIYIGMRS